MELFYEGTDITGFVDIQKCVFRETAATRCDALELELDHASAWYGWGPKADDQIKAAHGGFDTGTLYLNTILPEDGRFRILATSMPSAVRRKAWHAYENTTLAQLFASIAAECSMTSALYGINGDIVIPFMLRKNEGCAAFLDRLMQWEGAALKAVNGRLTGIGIAWAQALPATETIAIEPKQRGVTHIRRSGMQYAGITVRTPYAQANAKDTQAQGSNRPVITDLPATDALTAGRWARGLLLHNNRMAETLHIDMAYRPGLTAMARIDIESSADLAGEWITHAVEHDMKNEKTAVQLLRCVTSIV